uniref:Uncharacterized protein n=1 Tax=Ditylenchus dipsaci TaxID=166011 RepID=A0A915CS79_9BILA
MTYCQQKPVISHQPSHGTKLCSCADEDGEEEVDVDLLFRWQGIRESGHSTIPWINSAAFQPTSPILTSLPLIGQSSENHPPTPSHPSLPPFGRALSPERDSGHLFEQVPPTLSPGAISSA